MWFCNTAAGFFVAIYMYEMLVRIHYPLSMFQRLAPGHLRYPLAFIHEQKGLFFTEVSVAGGIIYSDKADLFGSCLESKEPASLFFSFCSICMNREQKGKVGGGGSLKTIIYVLILYLTSGQLASRVQYHKSNLSNTMWRCWHLIIVFLESLCSKFRAAKTHLVLYCTGLGVS